MKSWFFEKIKKLTSLLVRLIKKNRIERKLKLLNQK